MPYPATGAEVRRPDLEGVLEEFNLQADRAGFAATRILPVYNVPVDSGKYHYIPIEELLQKLSGLERAPGAGYAQTDFTWKEGSFATQELGVEIAIDDKMRNRYADFPMEVAAANLARDMVLRHVEVAVAEALLDTTTFANDDVTVAWDVSASATPITDINAAMEAMFETNGVYPNKLVVNRLVYQNLLACEQVLAKLPTTRDKTQSSLGAADLASAFGLDEVVVAGGAKNTAAKGQEKSIAHIWGSTYAMLVKTMDDSGSPYDVGVGRLLHYSADGSNIGGTIETYRDNPRRGDKLRCRMEATPKIYYPECGYLLGGITTVSE